MEEGRGEGQQGYRDWAALKTTVRHTLNLSPCKQGWKLKYLPWKIQGSKRSRLKSLAKDSRVFKGFTIVKNSFVFLNVILDLDVLFPLTECLTPSLITH